jgi:hypothetical protein
MTDREQAYLDMGMKPQPRWFHPVRAYRDAGMQPPPRPNVKTPTEVR